ncbi:hypothetical protein pb186bvf_002462 [Paramecium bursaria]
MIQYEFGQNQMKKLDYESDLLTDEMNQRLKQVLQQSQNKQTYEYPEILKEILSDDPSIIYNGLLCLNKYLDTDRDPALPQVVDNQLITCLFKIIKTRQTPYHQYQALKSLIYIGQQLKQSYEKIIDKGIIQILIDIIKHDIYELTQLSLQSLGVFAKNRKLCHRIIQGSGQDIILQLLIKENDIQIQKSGIVTLSILCQEDRTKQFKFDKNFLPFLCQKFIFIKEPEVLKEVLLAIAQLTDDSDMALEILTKSQIVCQIANYINDENLELAEPALRIIGNLSTGNEPITQAAIESGVFNYIPQWLKQTRNKKITREICWMLSNIAAGCSDQANFLLNQQEIMTTISQIGINCNQNIKKEIIFLLCNLTQSISDQSIDKLINYNFFKICQINSFKDTNVIRAINDAINNIRKNVKPQILEKWMTEIENITKKTDNLVDES